MTLTALSASSATTIGTAPVASSPASPAAPVDAVGPTEDGGRPHGHQHAHGGHGHVRQALMQALGDMGMSTAPGNDGHGQGNLKHDIAQFMHTLFQAVGGQAGSSTGGPRAGFGAGLSALITDASQGKAPAALQAAFDRLAADLKLGTATPAAAPTDAVSAGVPVSSDPIGTVSTAGASAAAASTTTATTEPVADASAPVPTGSASATPATPTPTPAASPVSASGLQALLSRLQQQLGYGAANTASSPSVLGNTVDLSA